MIATSPPDPPSPRTGELKSSSRSAARIWTHLWKPPGTRSGTPACGHHQGPNSPRPLRVSRASLPACMESRTAADGAKKSAGLARCTRSALRHRCASERLPSRGNRYRRGRYELASAAPGLKRGATLLLLAQSSRGAGRDPRPARMPGGWHRCRLLRLGSRAADLHLRPTRRSGVRTRTAHNVSCRSPRQRSRSEAEQAGRFKVAASAVGGARG